jgi:hypothetical protein
VLPPNNCGGHPYCLPISTIHDIPIRHKLLHGLMQYLLKVELYYSFYFAIRIFGANIRIVFEYSVPSPSPSESKQHWFRCRCSRSFTSRTNITSGGYRNVSVLMLLRIRLVDSSTDYIYSTTAFVEIFGRLLRDQKSADGYERNTRSAV